ncbi:MAG: HD-GYP domain-containing protein [Peptostreptococcaceae bacterium]|nr:HD-GYP domain-containing protein [Peptostreptococcaceae bacterium]
MKDMKLNAYTILVSFVGFVILIFSAIHIIEAGIWFELLFFVFLAILTESMPIIIDKSTFISLGFAIGLASMLLFDPLVVPMVIAIGTILRIEKIDGVSYHIFNTSFQKRFFNGSAYAISALLASYSYEYGNAVFPGITIGSFSVVGIVLAIAIYIFANTLIYMILFSLVEDTTVLNLLKRNFWVAKNFIAIAPLGVLMAISYKYYGAFALLMFYGPLLLARYSFILYLEMKNVYLETIKALSNSVDAKDQYTNGHSRRVAHYAMDIAHEMNLAPWRLENIKIAATLHDIGKIGIRDYILNKPGKLTADEHESIKTHPRIGANILDEVRFLREVSQIILHHHERYDGKGYPDGLSGDEISIEDAILSIADTFDAVTTDRPYRKAADSEKAIEIILDEAGKQFVPKVVEAFRSIVENPKSKERFLNVG